MGSFRTYVYTGARGRTMEAWFEGIREGHAFVSSGPLVELTVNGRIPGEDIALPASGGEVDVEARVRSITPLDRAFFVMNGKEAEARPGWRSETEKARVFAQFEEARAVYREFLN